MKEKTLNLDRSHYDRWKQNKNTETGTGRNEGLPTPAGPNWLEPRSRAEINSQQIPRLYKVPLCVTYVGVWMHPDNSQNDGMKGYCLTPVFEIWKIGKEFTHRTYNKE